MSGRRRGPRAALRNRGFLVMSTFDGVLSTHQVLLNVVIPLWLVQETDAPRELLALLFGTNTVMAVALQVAAARGVADVTSSLRAQRRGAFFFVLSCAIVLVTHDTVGWVTIALVWLGHVTVTGAELYQSAGQWGLQAELSDPDRRGEYQGVANLGYTMGTVWAPAAFTFLAMEVGTWGWLSIAAIVVLAALAVALLVGASKRRDRSAAGLSREARSRDRANPVLAAADAAPTGRQVEQAAVVARRGGEVAVVESAPPVPFVAPDPQALGVSRRQFFNRSIVGMMGLGLSGFGGASLAFLWPQGVSGFGSKIKVGNFYVNRNQIGAVVESQPFGGEGLSGTGPKAGGPPYVARFATERVVTVDTTAAGGNASLLASM